MGASAVWWLVAFDQRLAAHTRDEIFFDVNWDAGVKSSVLSALFLRWRKHNIPVSYMSIFTALQVDRAGQAFVAVKGATGDAWNFLVIDDGGPILHHRYRAAHQCDVEALPLAGIARHFRRRRNEAIDSASVMAWRLLNRVIFNLQLVSPAQVNAAVRCLSTVELDVQFKITELRIVDKLGPMPRTHQPSIFSPPCSSRVFFVRPPPAQIPPVEQLQWTSPSRSARSRERWRSLANPGPLSTVWSIHGPNQMIAFHLPLKHQIFFASLFFLWRDERQLTSREFDFGQCACISPSTDHLSF